MSRLTLDEHSKIISAMWKHPTKYRSKVVVTDHGHGHFSIGPDRTSRDILNEVEADEKANLTQSKEKTANLDPAT